MLGMDMKQFSHSRKFAPILARALVVLLAGGAMGACQNRVAFSSEPQLSVKEKFPISVKPQQETMQLQPLLAGKSVGPADAVQITNFAGAFLQDGHGPLAIILPGIPDSPHMRGQVQAINEILADRGVPASRIEWRIATPGVAAPAAAASAAPAQPLTFSFTRYVASVTDECGNWENDFTENHDNKTWENFGCASQHNLAAMVSDPLDLKRPRASTPVDVDRRTIVIKAYREGKATTSERKADEKGTVSEVAK